MAEPTNAELADQIEDRASLYVPKDEVLMRLVACRLREAEGAIAIGECVCISGHTPLLEEYGIEENKGALIIEIEVENTRKVGELLFKTVAVTVAPFPVKAPGDGGKHV